MDLLSLSQRESKALSNLEDFSPEQVNKLCRNFLQRLLLGSQNVAPLDDKLTSAVEAIGTLLIDAAKTQCNETQLKGVLQEQGLSPDVSTVILNFYQQHGETIVSHLGRIGISFPQVVGIDWRLDYMVRSKSAGRENIPMFHVALRVMEDEKMRDVTFVASLEEMQDLLSKVRICL